MENAKEQEGVAPARAGQRDVPDRDRVVGVAGAKAPAQPVSVPNADTSSPTNPALPAIRSNARPAGRP